MNQLASLLWTHPFHYIRIGITCTEFINPTSPFIKVSKGLIITTYSARYINYSEQQSISDKSSSLRKDSLNLNAYQPQLVNYKSLSHILSGLKCTKIKSFSQLNTSVFTQRFYFHIFEPLKLKCLISNQITHWERGD